MTREEAKEYLDNYRKMYVELAPERFLEALDIILNEPSLPSNLDEAAENRVTENGRFEITSFEKMRIEDIMFGAEWMAGQFQKIDGSLDDWYSTSDGKDYCHGIRANESFEVPEGFYIKKK